MTVRVIGIQKVCWSALSGPRSLGLLASCLTEKSMTDGFLRQKTRTIVTSAPESTMRVPLQRMCDLVVLLIFYRDVPNATPRETQLWAGTNEERGPTAQFFLWL